MSSRSLLSILLGGFGILAAPSLAYPSNNWGTTPLGPALEDHTSGSLPIKQALESKFRQFSPQGDTITIFAKDQAQCLIVVPTQATSVEKRAAKLLQSSLEEMTGSEFQICSEANVILEQEEGTNPHLIDQNGRAWPHAIWLGRTEYSAKKNLNVDSLKPEGYQIVTRGPWLFIMGRDSSPSISAVQGTYFGAASLLERHLGFRWLWPGDVGTVTPKSRNVVLTPIHEQDEPAIPKRTIRNMAANDRAQVGLEILQADVQEYQKTLDLNAAWLANQKTGSSMTLNYGHAYSDWYERFGTEHPDWFALQPNGSRKQGPIRPRLCKSNFGVAHEAALQVIDDYARNPNLDCASISPNDGGPQNWFCMCEDCRKLDPKNGISVALLFEKDGKRFEEIYPSLTNRFVTFYNRIAEEVVKTLPNAKMGAYAYSSYRDAPQGIQVHPAVIIGFVGLVYDNESQRNLDLARWDAWCRHASHLILRPNAFHTGDALPLVYPHRLADDVRHCYQTGMIAADFDSLIGNWASDGLNYYVLSKILWDPSLDVDGIIKDYCQSGFGPAADLIARYFSELERATDRVAQQDISKIESQLREEERDLEPNLTLKNRDKTPFQIAYFEVFNPALIASLRDILHQAHEKADGNQEIVARIDFLKKGLDYVDIYHRTLEAADSTNAKRDLLAWYRDTFQKQPLSINTPHRLWKTAKYFQSVK